MAEKLTARSALTTPAGEDLIHVVDDPSGTPASYKATLSDVSKGLDAGNIPNTPAGTITSTNTQGAIDENNFLLSLNSRGVVTMPTITDNLDGTIDVGIDGIFNMYKDATATTGLVQITMSTGLTSQVLTDETINYLYVDYNGGTPIWGVSIVSLDFFSNYDWTAISRIVREGNDLHFVDYDEYGTALATKSLYKDIALNAFQRQSGLTLSTAATRVSKVELGSAWFAVNLIPLAENEAGVSGELFEYYKVAGVWNETLVTQYDSIYYSDGTDRQTLGANQYVSKYFFRGVEDDNHVYYIHGNTYPNVAAALDEPLPTPPPLVIAHALYVGKIIIKQAATNGTAYPVIWDSGQLLGSVVNHDDLANIEIAANLVTYGHINDQTQTIAGAKTFSTSVTSALIKGTTIDTNNATQAIQLNGTTISATGTDTNINITATSKGTGRFILPTGGLTLGTASSSTGSTILHNATNANTVTIQSGVTSASYTMTLPTAVAAGAGYVLTDAAGNGVLSWAAAGGGTTWGDSIDGTAESSDGITISNVPAGFDGLDIQKGDTTGVGARIEGLQGNMLSLNNFAAATQMTTTARGIILGDNANTNSAVSWTGMQFTNEENAGIGFNTGMSFTNNSTTMASGSSYGNGAGMKFNQLGVDGTSLAIKGFNNVNASTNGLINMILTDTQSGPTIFEKKSFGTSAQAHIGELIEMPNASTGARGVKVDTGSTGTGQAFEAVGTKSFGNYTFSVGASKSLDVTTSNASNFHASILANSQSGMHIKTLDASRNTLTLQSALTSTSEVYPILNLFNNNTNVSPYAISIQRGGDKQIGYWKMDSALGLMADVTTDTAPIDDTSIKRFTIQKLASPPANAAYVAFANNPGTDTFYLVMEEG